MPRQRKAPTPTHRTPDDRHVRWAPAESHPSQVSGLFADDPTFEEFCEIVRQQREEDSQRASEDIAAVIRQAEEAKRCASSTPTPSRTTNARTPSSAHE